MAKKKKRFQNKRRIIRRSVRSGRKFAFANITFEGVKGEVMTAFDKTDPRFAAMFAPFGCRMLEADLTDKKGKIKYTIIDEQPNPESALLELERLLNEEVKPDDQSN